MAIAGETFVALRVLSADLDKEIALAMTNASKKASEAAFIKPKVDASGATAELGKLEQAGTRVRQNVEHTANSSGVLGRAMNELRGKLASVAEQGGPVSSALAKVSQDILALGPEAALAAIALAAVVGTVFIGIEKFQSFAEQVHRFQLVTGASAEDSSRFVVALKLMGVSSDTVGTALFRFGRNLDSGRSQLHNYGIETARNADGSTNLTETFLRVADAVKASGDGAAASRIAFDAFGRQGKSLLPILQLGREGLNGLFKETDKNHEILHEQDLQNMIKFKVQSNDLKESINGLGIQIGEVAIGPVGELITGATRLTQIIGGELASKIASLKDLMSLFGIHLGGSASAASKLGEAMKIAAAEANDLQTAVEKVVDATIANNSADLAEQAATLAVASAKQNATKIEIDHAQAIVSANEALANSTYSLTQATEAQTRAQQDYNDAQEGAARESEGLALRVDETANASARADEALARGHFHGRDAALDRADAEDKARQASIDHANAVAAFNKAQSEGIDGSLTLAQAQRTLDSTTHGVLTAQQAQAKAQKTLNDLEHDPAYYTQLAQAKLGIATAENGLAGAKNAHVHAAETLKNALDLEATAFSKDAGGVAALKSNLQDLADTYHISIQPIIDQINQIGGGATGPIGPAGATGPGKSSKGVGSRLLHDFSDLLPLLPLLGLAEGGDTEAGRWYRVNENGPEFFRPNSNGRVIPIGAPDHPGSGNGGIHQQFNITESGSPSHTAQLVSIHTGRALRTASR